MIPKKLNLGALSFSNDEIEMYYVKLNPIIELYLQSDHPSLKKLSIETVNKLADTPKAI